MQVVNAVPRRSGIGVRLQRPRLGSEDSAAQSLNISLNAFSGGRFASPEFGGIAQGAGGGVSSWISGINAANWTQIAYMISSRTATEANNLTYNVIGQLGSDEGDQIAQALKDKWIALKAQADAALENPPGWFSEGATSFLIFASDFSNGAIFERDFVVGASAGWQYLVSRGAQLARPALESFHDSVERITYLKKDLAAARTSGKFTQAQLVSQQSLIDSGEAALNKARAQFSTLSSGASLDMLAQQAFGNYSLGAAGPAIPIALSLATIMVCAIAATVYWASSIVDKIPAMIQGVIDKILPDQNSKRVAGGVLALLFIVGIPLLLQD